MVVLVPRIHFLKKWILAMPFLLAQNMDRHARFTRSRVRDGEGIGELARE
ncbi:hypothetical protein [Helicobacter zhangjianzhongii]|uniref:Uncharacterized protein n=1 Tax=Helicobacter zhangjianzhongii TaxID=2974574 RepID=A0ACC6FV09_9HELI|nr:MULTISPECIES: hypothetical protein [unclassified Helicobacter]MDL0080534.1 hypothetical protein [Helicobacter sp. CPD2-1]MDL0082825.1 hypothetical protein [Helicobacter sp. XJK30-2]